MAAREIDHRPAQLVAADLVDLGTEAFRQLQVVLASAPAPLIAQVLENAR